MVVSINFNYLSDEEYIPPHHIHPKFIEEFEEREGGGGRGRRGKEGERERERVWERDGERETGRKRMRTLALPAGIIGLKYEEVDQPRMPSKNRLIHLGSFPFRANSWLCQVSLWA